MRNKDARASACLALATLRKGAAFSTSFSLHPGPTAVELRRNSSALMQSSFAFSPGGTPENSPRFQPWVYACRASEPQRGDRMVFWTHRAQDVFFRPSGAQPIFGSNPRLKPWAIFGRPSGTKKNAPCLIQRWGRGGEKDLEMPALLRRVANAKQAG